MAGGYAEMPQSILAKILKSDNQHSDICAERFQGPKLKIPIQKDGMYRNIGKTLMIFRVDANHQTQNVFTCKAKGRKWRFTVHNSDGDENTFSVENIYYSMVKNFR